jgi:5-methylcytosine-specific restriction endonuclease McrA
VTKKLTITKIKAQLWKLVSAYIKKRDHNTCWHCGKIYDGSGLHASHILPKGQYPNYEFCSWNLKSLCMHCHLQWWHKNPLMATEWLRNQHPLVYKKAMEMEESYSTYPKSTPEQLLQLKLKLENTF